MNSSKQRILITGAGGFLGSHIAQYFASRQHPIAEIGRFKIRDKYIFPNTSERLVVEMTLPDIAFGEVVKGFKPDVLVHCAGTASVVDSVKHPYKDFQKSVDVCAFVMDNIRKYMPSCKYILLSSAAVYGNPTVLPISEYSKCRPISPYGYHKMMTELLMEEYSKMYSISVANLRIFSAYGPRQYRQVIHDLFKKAALQKENVIEILGTGDESRDFIHAQDVAQAVSLIMKEEKHNVFNVASGTDVSIRELAEFIRHSFGSRKELVFVGDKRPGYPINWCADISRIRSLGFKQKVSLRQGVDEYCKWFLHHYPFSEKSTSSEKESAEKNKEMELV